MLHLFYQQTGPIKMCVYQWLQGGQLRAAAQLHRKLTSATSQQGTQPTRLPVQPVVLLAMLGVFGACLLLLGMHYEVNTQTDLESCS